MSFIVATLLSNQKFFKRDFSECATVHLSDEEAEENDEKKIRFHERIRCFFKGQLISECPFGVKTSSKKPTKFLP